MVFNLVDDRVPAVELPTLPATLGQRWGCYLHVPFCRSRCGYCDFNTYTPRQAGESIESYLRATHSEIDMMAEQITAANDRRPRFATIFVGGGTPTMLTPDQLGELIAHLGEVADLAGDIEITTEANPETLSPQILDELLARGFNRISIGMQSAMPHVLATLERVHTPRKAIDMARAARECGFAHVNLDLIFGTPGESLDDWRESLDQALSADPDHISAYALIVEQGTPFARKVRHGQVDHPGEDDLADKYALANQVLTASGFANYEISNWARDNGECRHNLLYWRNDNWWGIGPGAHSHCDGLRWWNLKNPRRYVAALDAGALPVADYEQVTDYERHEEALLLGLRLAEGVGWDVLTPTERVRAEEFVATGRCELVRGEGAQLRLVVAEQSRFIADGIIADILD